MIIKRPPKGYYKLEFPLPHRVHYRGGLGAHSSGQRATLITLCRTTNDHVSPDTIETYPENTNFSEDAGPLVKKGSIVPKIGGVLKLSLTKGFLQTNLGSNLAIYIIPIAASFKRKWDPDDKLTGDTVADVFEVSIDSVKEDVTPIFNGTDLNLGSTYKHPVSDINKSEGYSDYDLTTNKNMEGITFDEDKLSAALRYYSNSAAIRAVMGKIIRVTLTKNHPYARIKLSRFGDGSTKRGLEYGFNGFIILVPKAGTERQMFEESDITNIDHMYFDVDEKFDEWHNGHNSEEM